MKDTKVEMVLSEDNMGFLIGSMADLLKKTYTQIGLQESVGLIVDRLEVIGERPTDMTTPMATKDSVVKIEAELNKKLNRFNESYALLFNLVYKWLDSKEEK